MALHSAKEIARAFRKGDSILFIESLSNNETYELLRSALRELIPTGDGFFVWIVDVWPDYVVYEYERPGQPTQFFKRPYLLTDDGAVEFGDPAEVERKTEYVAVGEAAVDLNEPARRGWDETETSFRFRVRPPGDFGDATFRTISLGDSGVKAVIGKLEGETSTSTQALIFPKAKFETLAAAKKWLKDHPDAGATKKKESLSEVEVTGQIIPLVEAYLRPDGTVPIKIIEPGWGSSAFYPADVLKRDGPKVFTEGMQMFWDHQTETEEAERPEGECDDVAAVLATPAHWEDNHPAGPGLYSDAKVMKHYAEKLGELAPYIGVSIRTKGVAEAGEAEGREGFILTELLKAPHSSVDFVTKAGAGGAVLDLFESLRPQRKGSSDMENVELKETKDKLAAAEAKVAEFEAAEAAKVAEETRKQLAAEAATKITEALKDKDLPEPTKKRLIETLSTEPPTKDGKLDEEVLATRITEASTAEAAYLESITGSGGVQGMGGSSSTDGRKALEESVRRLHPNWTDEQVRIYTTGR